MKNKLFTTAAVALLLIAFSQCSEDETVMPRDQVQQSAPVDARESASARKVTGKYLATPITGTIAGQAFSAEFRITQFVHNNNTALYAVGTLANITGTNLTADVLAALGGQQIKMPVDLPDGTARASSSGRIACDILILNLGPLDLDLLGLQIHLDEVVLEIVAEAGGGNLLGNLLCAVASLLDGAAALAAIAELLNAIIDLIGVLP